MNRELTSIYLRNLKWFSIYKEKMSYLQVHNGPLKYFAWAGDLKYSRKYDLGLSCLSLSFRIQAASYFPSS